MGSSLEDLCASQGRLSIAVRLDPFWQIHITQRNIYSKLLPILLTCVVPTQKKNMPHVRQSVLCSSSCSLLLFEATQNISFP